MLLARRLMGIKNIYNDAYALQLSGQQGVGAPWLNLVNQGQGMNVQQPFSVECWFYARSGFSVHQRHIFAYARTSKEYFRVFNQNGAWRFQWGWGVWPTEIAALTMAGTVVENAWNYFALSFNHNTIISTGFNGWLADYTINLDRIVMYNDPDAIGWGVSSQVGWGRPDANALTPDGYLSHARIYSAALSKLDIAASFQAGRTWHNLNHPNLFRYHACNQMLGGSVKDYSPGGISANIQNGLTANLAEGGYHWQNVSSL
jgi:hypothetical protein